MKDNNNELSHTGQHLCNRIQKQEASTSDNSGTLHPNKLMYG